MASARLLAMPAAMSVSTMSSSAVLSRTITPVVRRGELEAVTHDGHPGAGESGRAQPGLQVQVQFDRGDTGCLAPQDIGGQPGAGTDLQQVISELVTVQDPGQQLVLDQPGPFRAGAELQMCLVHRVSG